MPVWSRAAWIPIQRPRARYVVRYKRPIEMPGSPIGFLTTQLFSLKAKLAVVREPFVPRTTRWRREHRANL